MTENSPVASVSTLVARKEDDPRLWNLPKITFVSTCPKCGHERPQHGYTRRMLINLLNRHSKIDAYCFNCNVCWSISESERRAMSPHLSAMSPHLNASVQTCGGARSAWCTQRRRPRSPDWRAQGNPSEGRRALRQALLTLHAIRLRYEIDRRNSDTSFRCVLVALSHADMLWITATIQALEKAVAGPLARG